MDRTKAQRLALEALKLCAAGQKKLAVPLFRGAVAIAAPEDSGDFRCQLGRAPAEERRKNLAAILKG